MRKVPCPHPGEILLKEFLKPMGITQYRLAKEIGVPQRRIGEIVASARAVIADTGPVSLPDLRDVGGVAASRCPAAWRRVLDRYADGL
jgi:hypothetical protein